MTPPPIVSREVKFGRLNYSQAHAILGFPHVCGICLARPCGYEFDENPEINESQNLGLSAKVNCNEII